MPQLQRQSDKWRQTPRLRLSSETGGGADGDILNDDVHNRLLQRVSRGEFLAVIAAPPCSTFSVTRHFAADGSKDDGPPVVRDRANIRGIPNVAAKHLRELRQANAIVARMTVGPYWLLAPNG